MFVKRTGTVPAGLPGLAEGCDLCQIASLLLRQHLIMTMIRGILYAHVANLTKILNACRQPSSCNALSRCGKNYSPLSHSIASDDVLAYQRADDWFAYHR